LSQNRKDHRFPPERIELLNLLSQKEDIYERLARAIAPSIYENEDVKKGILLQLFGGTKKTFVTSGRTNFRAEINILLCGDPGKIFPVYFLFSLLKGVFQVHQSPNCYHMCTIWSLEVSTLLAKARLLWVSPLT
jgi:hypothetical protein